MLELLESRRAQNRKLLENSTFMEIMKENWLQVRHIVTMRILLAVAYAAFVAATLAYVVYRGTNNLPAGNTIVLFLPLLVISAVWNGITLRLNADAEDYFHAIRNAFVDGKIVGERYWWLYMGMPRSPRGRISKWLTAGNLLVLFYSVVGMASLVVIIVAAV